MNYLVDKTLKIARSSINYNFILLFSISSSICFTPFACVVMKLGLDTTHNIIVLNEIGSISACFYTTYKNYQLSEQLNIAKSQYETIKHDVNNFLTKTPYIYRDNPTYLSIVSKMNTLQEKDKQLQEKDKQLS